MFTLWRDYNSGDWRVICLHQSGCGSGVSILAIPGQPLYRTHYDWPTLVKNQEDWFIHIWAAGGMGRGCESCGPLESSFSGLAEGD